MENHEHTPQVLPQLASLNRVVLDLIDLYQPAFAWKRLGSGLDLDPSLPLTWIDAPQLERGLGHVLRHAVNATKQGDLILCRTQTDGDWVELTIGDSGPRISDEQAAKLFHSDHDDQGPRARRGLDTSRAIIAAHGGDIRIDTKHGHGAWFVVRLPAIALENARLVDELERGHRAQYDLVATLSSELRTPLNVILGYNDLLIDGTFGQPTPGQADALRRIEHSARALLDMIADTLNLSRARHSDLGKLGELNPLPSSAEHGRIVQWLAQQNKRLLEAVARSKRLEVEFVTTMSHQLRIPLNAILGYDDLLLDGEFGALTTEQASVLKRARSSAMQLLDAINTNLDFGRGRH
ncbi:MAG TPA: histidine kinase dimerization/phospho-acceptor domain-containing protein [Candidatus Binatia bacterium]|nr:histidine kinase dimerization/phospho-acceptor domain-containing protein [Candidatus Binatia bacterium]